MFFIYRTSSPWPRQPWFTARLNQPDLLMLSSELWSLSKKSSRHATLQVEGTCSRQWIRSSMCPWRPMQLTTRMFWVGTAASTQKNRAATGVDPFNAQNLTLKISLQGYSESKLENPMGFEKAAPGAAASAQEAFMARNYNLAAGYLKTIPVFDAHYLPVTCSHTFAALNIIEEWKHMPRPP